MNIFQMERFIEITKYDSIHIAADNMYLSTQTISKAIHVLEKELNTTLFYRTVKGISLTKDGEKFLNFAIKTTAAYKELLGNIGEEKLIENKCKVTGNLKIYAVPSYDFTVIPNSIKNFQHKYKNINISFLNQNSKKIANILNEDKNMDYETVGLFLVPYINGKADSSILKLKNDIVLHPIKLCRYVLCVSNDSKYSKNKSMSIKTILKNEKIVAFTSDNPEGSPMDYSVRQYGTPNYIFSTTSVPVFLDAVGNNVGIGLINEDILKENPYFEARKNEIMIVQVKQPILLLYCAGFHSEHNKIVDYFISCLPSTLKEFSD